MREEGVVHSYLLLTNEIAFSNFPVEFFARFSRYFRRSIERRDDRRRSSVHGRIRGRMDGRGKVASSLDGLWALPMHRA